MIPAAPTLAPPTLASPTLAAPPRLLDRLGGDRTTPARLRLLLAGTVAFSLLWGAAAAWTAAQRASGAGDVVTASEPLSFDAQQIYQSLSDADATEAVAFLAGTEPPAARDRYLADIARAETYLEAATAAAGNQGPRARLTVLSTEVPVYAGLVETARSDNLQGLPVGAAFLGEASNLMRTRLLPAADGLYAQENARLAAADGQATALPILAMIVAIAVGFVLLRAQRWLTRRTHRTFNSGLVAASVAGLVSLIWLLTGLTVARVQLLDARDHGSAPVEALAQADIAALGAHADESLTLINRVGDDANQANFLKAERRLGPGPGTLLTQAAAAASGSPGAGPAAAAAAALPPGSLRTGRCARSTTAATTTPPCSWRSGPRRPAPGHVPAPGIGPDGRDRRGSGGVRVRRAERRERADRDGGGDDRGSAGDGRRMCLGLRAPPGRIPLNLT
jgi:hypothetical protein